MQPTREGTDAGRLTLKRKNPPQDERGRPLKRVKSTSSVELQRDAISRLYPRVETLRNYLAKKLPSSSRIRRKKLLAAGTAKDHGGSGAECDELALAVARLLNTTTVGVAVDDGDVARSNDRWARFVNFASTRADDARVASTASPSQTQIVNFAIWHLFSCEKSPGLQPPNLLCDGFGFRKDVMSRRHAGPQDPCEGTVFVRHFNDRAASLSNTPWPQVLSLLGKPGERIMIDLLLDCAIFVSINSAQGSYWQIAGEPVFTLQSPRIQPASIQPRKLKDIVFVRNRILYARPALSSVGQVQFGFRHIHALTRFATRNNPRCVPSNASDDVDAKSASSRPIDGAKRLLMYIFPRQFGLHNAFTSVVDRTTTAQKFQDYTFREEEIYRQYGKLSDPSQVRPLHIPKRLRGEVLELVRKMLVLHSRCSYSKMMEHYCPTPNSGQPTLEIRTNTSQSRLREKTGRNRSRLGRSLGHQNASTQSKAPSCQSLADLAVPQRQVSAFCRAILVKVVPQSLWGSTSTTQEHNLKLILHKVDQFIRLRRFEAMNLHDVVHGVKILDIKWLASPLNGAQKTSSTDIDKRKELFHEFIYYIFDSILIPLIRSNFYVTESSVYRLRLFYFRHDVWRSIAEPAMAVLKTKMFEEVKIADAMRIIEGRRLGFGQVRLLPKANTMRPITNLRNRTLTLAGSSRKLGVSVNKVLEPLHEMLKFEKTMNPSRLGATMFSVGDMFERIKAFREMFARKSVPTMFYLAKLDVQAAFDTIPQDAIMELMKTIPSKRQYEIVKFVELQLRKGNTVPDNSEAAILQRWRSAAYGSDQDEAFKELLERTFATGKSTRTAIYINGVMKATYNADVLTDLLASHVQQNLVKIGKKYYRQKEGIPQGSILSSMLCNLFYADMEQEKLSFLSADDSLLLRLVDDFMLITTDKSKAAKFVHTLQRGVPKYGVNISMAKTLVNFDFAVDINGSNDSDVVERVPVARIPAAGLFPYCGSLIDCRTLEITKDRRQPWTAPARSGSILGHQVTSTSAAPTPLPPNMKDCVLSNALTVEFSRRPGLAFQRKMLHAFRIQSHLMFYDCSHNSTALVRKNLYNAFSETASKTWAYIRCLPPQKRPSAKLMCAVLGELVDVAHTLLTSKERSARLPGYECRVSKMMMRFLAFMAFRSVLERKQAGFAEILSWLERELRLLLAKDPGLVKGLPKP